MIGRSRWTLAVVVPAVIVATGCNGTETADTPQAADRSQVAPRPGQPDTWLTTQIQARYFSDPMLRGKDVDVSTEAGVVTLAGTVGSEAAKAQAVRLAQQIEGVTRVDDKLQVESTVATEDASKARTQSASGDRATQTPTAGDRLDAAWATTKIQAQYFADPDVKGRNIDVTTDSRGTVTLRGRVDSEAARKEALRIARETKGVLRVVDELRMETSASETPAESTRQASDALEDSWITAKIQSKYFLDTDVKGRDIDVHTQNGVVTLSGQVASPAERRQAVNIARNTDGVSSVRDELSLHAVTALAGEPSGPNDALETPIQARKAVTPPDGWITTKIQSKFFLSGEIRGQSIDVMTAGGVVTLQGRVDSDVTRRTAETIAGETRGVRRVVNQLTVGNGTD
jgi:osmotically-inducible protein OsmY